MRSTAKHDSIGEKDSAGKNTRELGIPAIAIHLAIALLAIAALLTGELAGDYKKIDNSGFILHKWIGMGLGIFIALRLITGVLGGPSVRFSAWVPYTKERLQMVWEDIKELSTLRIPERPLHQGLAGLVQTFGILATTWIALTGTAMVFLIEPGHKARGLAHLVKELHESGFVFLLVFLSLHAGAVVIHALKGRHVWKKMVFISEQPEKSSTSREKAPADGTTHGWNRV